MVSKNKLGIFVTCFDEVDAITYALNSVNKIYSKIPIYLNCEGTVDFSHLEKELNISINYVEDTLSNVLNITEYNFKEQQNQQFIKKATIATIDRIDKSIEFLNSEYILLHCSDTLIRGPITIPKNSHLLGSRVNKYFFPKVNDILIRNGGIKVTAFGAVPAIFKVQEYLIARDKFIPLVDEFCSNFYAMFSHDVLMSVLFSLIGYEEEYNSEIVECTRNSNWKNTQHPLVHQFREFYPVRKGKYGVNN